MNPDDIARRERQLAGTPWRRFLQTIPGQMLANPPVFRLHQELLIHRDHRVLEVGCGAGSRLLLLDNAVKFERHSAAGVEPSPRLARRAGRNFLRNARPLTAFLADPAALPFSDASFDMAVCGDLLRFLDVRGAQAALREIARVLRPGAIALLWDLAPPEGRFARWQRFWLRAYREDRIAGAKSLMSLAERSRFAYSRDAELRPYFWPPVPRASFIAGTLPPGWRVENGNLIPPPESP
ncbi:MAG: class I SAM-dependent methyltransferase [Dehalococcoidia bacterium]